MAGNLGPPSLNTEEQAFSFIPEVPQKVHRAWERTPKSPFGGRLSGRKVWKRFDTLNKENPDDNERIGSDSVLRDTTNTHAAKRLRLKGTQDDSFDTKENRPRTYLATLHDDPKETPRRKDPRPESLRTGLKIHQPPPDSASATETALSESTVQEDDIRPSLSPALDETRELLGQMDKENDTRDAENVQPHWNDENAESPVNPARPEAQSSLNDKTVEVGSADAHTADHERENGSFNLDQSPSLRTAEPSHSSSFSPTTVTEASTRLNKSEVDTAISSKDELSGCGFREEASKSSLCAPQPKAFENADMTLVPDCSQGQSQLKQIPIILSPDSGSPQIGTSLLRRESLRKRETPSKKRESRRTKSPRKRDTLSRRDTLQEREILQKVINENNECHPSKEIAKGANEATPSPDTTAINSVQGAEHADPATDASQPAQISAPGMELASFQAGDADVEKDLHRAMEAIEVLQQPEPIQTDSLETSNLPMPVQAGDSLPDAPVDQDEEIKRIDEANKILAETELEQAMESAEARNAQRDLPHRTTRSGTRFSDDTSMLRDFLNRAQASKAAKTPVIAPLDAPKPQISPRRSPRKAHGSHKGTSSTPQRCKDNIHRPGTPPEINKADILEPDDAEEITATPTSCHRSTRKRVPAPSKAPPGAPSFIPVKRADGGDPVVLQKSQAQELAMVTRANTRRNKGQSKPPLVALKDLPKEASEDSSAARERVEKGKAVGWAEKLASYHDAKGKLEEAEDAKPRVRRMRGLGSTNGTPAPKKTAAVVDASNGTPAPKRRGKVISGK
ncbi:hypothetical protein ACLMJK_005516 [Lecanora helva]